MAAEDELALPQVPEVRPDDVEDVSWSLSTAEAMWARGDHLEGIKWVRKAAEAASEVENDQRALELAKAASELATIVARRSRASINDGPGLAGGAPPEMYAQPPSAPPGSATPPSVMPTTTRSHAPPYAPPVSSAPTYAPPISSAPTYAPPISSAPTYAPPISSAPAPPAARSSPPIPLPSMASSPPPPRSSSSAPAGLAAPRPFSAAETRNPPLQGRPVSPPRVAAAAGPKPRRRSRENLDQEARAANAHVNETAPLRAVDSEDAERVLRGADPLEQTATFTVPVVNRSKQRMHADPEPTIVARLEDLQPHRERSAAEWDSSPTENLTGGEMDQHMAAGDRQTAFAVPVRPPVAPAPLPLPAARPPQSTVHDPEIQTSQAVRVVVWRDANGVHVAPAGTVVSSITIDAVLVVLEEGADLTAWLSQRER